VKARGDFAALLNRRIAIILLLGFSSGLPLALTAGTLQAWFTVEGVDLVTIGFVSLVGLPYTLKFLWSPAMDRYAFPFLGRRRGWIVATQVATMAIIAASAGSSPASAPALLALLALALAFASASQDIVLDAYRADLLHPKERGVGAAVSVAGYRVAMLVSGAGALILSEMVGWRETYLVMASLMLVGILTTLASPEPVCPPGAPRSLREAIRAPLAEFLSRDAALALLALIVLYKLGDAFAGSLTTAFLIRGAGFSAGIVGTINKGLGLLALLLGALAGGTLMARIGLYRALMTFGILQMLSNLGFMLLAWWGQSLPLMITAVGFENLAGGLGTAAFVALLMALCDHRYTATQFALLTALAAIGRVWVGPAAGYLVAELDWALFFLLTTLAAAPGLLLLRRMRARMDALDGGDAVVATQT
jgi:PAT family beta-lactamase induction signal transducer AmpG